MVGKSLRNLFRRKKEPGEPSSGGQKMISDGDENRAGKSNVSLHSNSPDYDECAFCTEVARVLLREKKEGDRRFMLSNVRQAADGGCSRCEQFLVRVETEVSDRQKLRDFPEGDSRIYMYNHFVPAVSVGPCWVSIYRVEANPDSISANYPNETVQMQPNTNRVDIQRVASWIKACNESHRGICHHTSSPWLRFEQTKAEILLIDIQDMCLVVTDSSRRYIAVSYVWSLDRSRLTTTSATVEPLMAKNALSQTSKYGSRVPNTIRDAMQLASLLDVRYLWVDRLCIIQDDQDHIHTQIEAMASIYTNAYFTLVCRDGDDSRGICGLGPPSKDRQLPIFDVVEYPLGLKVYMEPWKDQVAMEKFRDPRNYWKRGWTLQESHLPHRKLEFGDDIARWKCLVSRVSEDREVAGAVSRDGKAKYGIYSPFPDLNAYTILTGDYARRYLTVPEDVEKAFESILQVFGRSLRRGLTHGHPDHFFDGSLLWQPRNAVQRRLGSNGKPLPTIPSWSHLAWHGQINFQTWTELHDFTYWTGVETSPYKKPHQALSPTTTFWKKRVSETALSRIESRYYADAAYSLLHQGAVEGSGIPKSTEGLDDSYAFRHFIEIPESPIYHDRINWDPVIQFISERVYLTVGPRISVEDNLVDCLDASLLSPYGQLVGTICINANMLQPGHISTNTSCELISLSKASVTRDFQWGKYAWPEWHAAHQHCDACETKRYCQADELWRVGDTYHYVNVMWIHWREDGVAERKAVGRVIQSYWDSMEKETLEVRLG
ncbi:heterokaryon incompatibility protein-domain-containing protein [Echria macrotheca]|uniref:Heterokaryon incompatibility protein-domain-containing protein n=1 Tax=Echria macrotheca TaxID=438768 RepID=A0AAJ0B389_9PEZI|nr:heterokaryon incompatibility protein-domain-containing protein [Echria macrotheca]